MARSQVGIQDSGSNYNYFESPRRPHLPKSLFDLSYINTGTADIGLLIPIYLQETVPGDEFTISCEALLRCVNPPVVPLLSRLRVFFHFYWSSCESLWKGFPMFITKGRSGNYSIQAPTVKTSSQNVTPTTLLHYLGIPSHSGGCSYPFSAMPFMMYMRVYRDYYMNQTLVNAAADNGQDTYWFPYDDEEFRLPITLNDGSNELLVDDANSEADASSFLAASAGSYRLNRWRWRNWANDYFTTARPWPQRGQEAALELNLGEIVFDSANLNVTLPADGSVSSSQYLVVNDDGEIGINNSSGSESATLYVDEIIASSALGDASITLSALRELNAAQRIMEKMALVDGSYGEFCQTFFAVNDPNSRNFKPYYIGGTYQKIEISEVINTADTYTSSGEGRSQGSQTGHASTYGNGFVGKFRASSYGYIMGIMSIMPDTMYFQGINRQFCRVSQEDWFIPERAGLSPQAILNREIFFQGSSVDDDLFGYQDRFDEMRYRPNEIHGKVADPSNLSFFPYTQARYFNVLPTLSPDFISTGTTTDSDPTYFSNVRSDWLTSSSEVPFVYQVANKVRAVRPLSYRAQPAELFDTRG